MNSAFYTHLYFYALVYLYSTLASEYFLFDAEDIDNPPEGIFSLGTYGGSCFDELVEWSLNEIITYCDEIPKNISDFEGLMDRFTAQFLGPLWHLARFTSKKHSIISVGRWVEYFYYQTVIIILNTFGDVVQELENQESYLYNRYITYIDPKIKQIISHLKIHAPCPNKNGISSKSVNDFIEMQAMKLAKYWKTTIYSSLESNNENQ